MGTTLLVLGLVWLLTSGDGSPSRAAPVVPGGPIPGVPPELQIPLASSSTTVAPEPVLPPEPRVSVTSSPAPSSEPSRTRQTRVSVQPDELPSSPELRHLPIDVRAEGRRLAALAGAAVMLESRRGGRRAPLEPVRAFQAYVGTTLAGAADGKWGRTTARAARLFVGPSVQIPGAVW